MNEAQKIYCDGAAMAYRDVAEKMLGMIERAPAEIRPIMEIFKPFAHSCEAKAAGIHDAAIAIEEAKRQ